jgi:hypothetical protein
MERPSAPTKNAWDIQGGVRKKLDAGDVVRVPRRVPHQVLLEGAHEFNYFVIKIKDIEAVPIPSRLYSSSAGS